MSYRALVLCSHLQRTIDHYRDLFAKHDVEIVLPSLDGKQQLDEADLLAIIQDYDGVIAGDDEFTAKVLEKGHANRLKVVAKWGIGVDGIDLVKAKELGLPVYNTPDAFADEVADVATGHIILLARQIHKLDQSVRAGGWLKVPGMTLRGKTLGVIGVGSIGRAIVRRGRALGMNVVGFDPVPLSADFVAETEIKSVSLDELYAASDFVALACNLNETNYHLINADTLAKMKDGVYIVNVARGPLIDETALVTALKAGKVAGAGLDVFEQEPLPLTSPLHQFDNCIFGTHNGSNTTEAVMRVNLLSIQNLFKGLGIEYMP